MKIRTGFVSNSSSSSFIIRGMKIKSADIINKFNISKEDIDDCKEDEYEIFDLLRSKLDDFSVEPDGNYFGERDYTTLIVGKSLGSLEDGDVVELKDQTLEQDQCILDNFEKYGFTGKLKTYIQTISNDNY